MAGDCNASSVLRRLRDYADPARAVHSRRFFRTGPGEYGAGDQFLGLTVPRVREIAAEFRALPLAEIETLLESPWHEARLLGAILLGEQYKRGDARTRELIYRLYLRRIDRINNWDLVDSSAPYVVGAHLERRSRAPLRRLARSPHLWERRIAMVATQHLIRLGEFDDTLRIAVMLLRDEHDLIHKAVGWMLREVGKRDAATLRAFLDRYAAEMPRTALRYSLERLPRADRERYMAARGRSTTR